MSAENSTCEGRPERKWGWLEVALILSIIALVVQLLPDIARAWREWPWGGWQTPGRAVVEIEQGGAWEVSYLVYLPREYSSRKQWPLLLYLHGSGERGDDLQRLRRNGPPALIDNGRHLPLVVVSPQCPKDMHWDSAQLLALLDKLEEKFSIDPARIYVTGYSMGGWGVWNLANAAPERFAAIVPVAGSAEGAQPERLLHLPIWAFHGAEDCTVPPGSCQNIVEAIRNLGGNARLTLYENQGHNIGNATFPRDDLWQWLLEQRRP
jgi:predicted peptidase